MAGKEKMESGRIASDFACSFFPKRWPRLKMGSKFRPFDAVMDDEQTTWVDAVKFNCLFLHHGRIDDDAAQIRTCKGFFFEAEKCAVKGIDSECRFFERR